HFGFTTPPCSYTATRDRVGKARCGSSCRGIGIECGVSRRECCTIEPQPKIGICFFGSCRHMSSEALGGADAAIDNQVSPRRIAEQIRARFRKQSARSIDLATGMLLCILAAAAWLPRAGGPIDLRWDGGAYYALGTSITQGQGYRILSEPGSPN